MSQNSSSRSQSANLKRSMKSSTRSTRSGVSSRVIQRPVAKPVQRSANMKRLAQNNLRRAQARETAAALQGRPAARVRPARPPQRVMPRTAPPIAPIPPRGTRVAYRAPAVSPQITRRTSTRVHPPTEKKYIATATAAAGAAIGLAALNASQAHPDISFEVSNLERELDDLKSTSSLENIRSDIYNLDSELNNALNLLESAREKGYVYQKEIDDIAYQMKSQWDLVRPKVEAAVENNSVELQNQLNTLTPSIQRLNRVIGNSSVAEPALRDASSLTNDLLRNAQGVEREIENNYNDIENQLHQLNSRLTQIHWALDQLSKAKIELETGEELVMAAPARWDKESTEDPEGVLYLTSKRLIFEQKEKIATKKVLFVTTASELVQQVLIDQPLRSIQSVKAANKGLFGHQDFLEVTFSDATLEIVPFHLDGQDSSAWNALIESAQSGKIDSERVTGSGLTIADLTKPLTQADIIALQNEVNELQDEMMLKVINAELAEVENEVRSLERSLAGVRSDGYAIESELEAEVAILAVQWDRIKNNADAILAQQTAILGEQMTSIQKMLASLTAQSGNLAKAHPLYLQIKSSIASAEAQADAAEATVLAQYDEYADEVEATGAHLDWINWMLEALSSASFRLLATESGVAAAEAIWEAPGLEPENGILFLTDQRLLWEDRVGDYELKIDVPLSQIEDYKHQLDDQSRTDYLEVSFLSGAPVPAARFQFSQPIVEEWLQMIGRARSGDYVRDRATPLSETELERVRNAPQQCHNCGAALTAPILRGQLEITCEYCGVVTRL